MNDAITLFHGSNVVVEKPQILVAGFYKDFGYGFYCTNMEKQAFWVLAKFKYPTHQMVICTQKSLKTMKFKTSISL